VGKEGKKKDISSENELTNLQPTESTNSSVSRNDNPGMALELMLYKCILHCLAISYMHLN